MEQEDDIEVELHFSCGLLVEVALTLLKRWAPTSYKWRYICITPINGLLNPTYRGLNPFIPGDGVHLKYPLIQHGNEAWQLFAGRFWILRKCWGHLTLTPASFFFGGFGFRPKSMKIPDSF